MDAATAADLQRGFSGWGSGTHHLTWLAGEEALGKKNQPKSCRMTRRAANGLLCLAAQLHLVEKRRCAVAWPFALHSSRWGSWPRRGIRRFGRPEWPGRLGRSMTADGRCCQMGTWNAMRWCEGGQNRAAGGQKCIDSSSCYCNSNGLPGGNVFFRGRRV